MGSNGKRKQRGSKRPAPKDANGKHDKPVPAVEPRAEAAKAEAKPVEADLAEAAAKAGESQGEVAPSGPPPTEEPRQGAAWAEPIAKFERGWTRVESKLLTFVLAAQILALVSWVFLKGLAQPVTADDSSGSVFRAVLLCSLVGWGAWYFTRKLAHGTRRIITMVSMAAAIAVGWTLTGFGSAYFDNVKGWLQEGSLLTLMGGLRGVATRLTLWLALLGGSLATAAGKHIHIDLIFRFLPKKLRIPAAIINYCAAALVCLAAVWGFFDHIATVDFGSKAEDSAGSKISRATSELGEHFFLARKQIGLDLRSFTRVLRGQRYDTWMTGAEWNEWVKGAGFEDRYEPAAVKNILVPDDTETHTPFVISPDGKATRGMLVDSLSLVFPFGLLAIGLRFLIRALLTLSGHLSADPDEAHKEDLKSAETKIEIPEGGA